MRMMRIAGRWFDSLTGARGDLEDDVIVDTLDPQLAMKMMKMTVT